eukprot:scaffold48589_cov48-Phaeocystis_antarctica.AAC.1
MVCVKRQPIASAFGGGGGDAAGGGAHMLQALCTRGGTVRHYCERGRLALKGGACGAPALAFGAMVTLRAVVCACGELEVVLLSRVARDLWTVRADQCQQRAQPHSHWCRPRPPEATK